MLTGGLGTAVQDMAHNSLMSVAEDVADQVGERDV